MKPHRYRDLLRDLASIPLHPDMSIGRRMEEMGEVFQRYFGAPEHGNRGAEIETLVLARADRVPGDGEERIRIGDTAMVRCKRFTLDRDGEYNMVAVWVDLREVFGILNEDADFRPLRASKGGGWEPITTAPMGEWLMCRHHDGGRIFEARKLSPHAPWLDRDGLYREPREWRRALATPTEKGGAT